MTETGSPPQVAVDTARPTPELQVDTNLFAKVSDQQPVVGPPPGADQFTPDANRALATLNPEQQLATPGTQPEQEVVDGVAEVVMDQSEVLLNLQNIRTNPNLFSRDQVERTLKDAKVYVDNPQVQAALQEFEQRANTRYKKLTAVFSAAVDTSPPVETQEASPPTTEQPTEEPTAAPPEEAPIQVEAAQPTESASMLEEQQALETLLEQPETLAEITPETIQEITRDNPDNLSVTVKDKQTGEPKKLTISTMLLVASLVAADLALFRGQYTMMAIQNAVGEQVHNMTNKVFAQLGFNIPERNFDRNQIYGMFVERVTTDNLYESMKQLKGSGQELFRMLTQMGKDQVQKMINGERFGGIFSNKHQFTQEQVTEIVNSLDAAQIAALGIKLPAKAETST